MAPEDNSPPDNKTPPPPDPKGGGTAGVSPDSSRAAPSAGVAQAKPDAAYKVELDIDGAPFLNVGEEEKKPEVEEKDELPPPPLQMETPKKAGRFAKLKALLQKISGRFAFLKPLLSTKKGKIIVAGVPLLLIIVGLALYFLVFRKSAPPEPATPPPLTTTVVVPSSPPREDTPAPAKFTYHLDRFFIPLRGSEGEIRFLRCGFTIPTDNEILISELKVKNIAVRDAIYYYLINKPLTFLADAKSGESLKEDIISIINENVATEKIRTIYIEDYMVSVN
ncbi:MAG: flagellar basal body-associated FliL family protein [Desulfovibrio sp.]|jgi:flagellar FliL protein|nr:flagellar basal body-associated FliL family protein [Desulfovibrio sp.]